MKKEGKVLAIFFIMGILLILSINIVSASLIADLGNFFKKIFSGGITGNVVSDTTWCNRADINKDGKVDDADKAIIEQNYKRTDCAENNSWCNGADIDRSGKVLAGDTGFLSANWLRTDCGGPVVCNANSDCGANVFIGENLCQNNDVFRNFITYTCDNPGTANSYCSNSTNTQIVTDCGDNSCGNFGNNYCKNGNVYSNKTCNDRGCLNSNCFNNQRIEEQLIQTCSNGCNNGTCLNAKCNDSDNGKNYYIKGITCEQGYCETDACIGSSQLAENFCENDQLTDEFYNCPSGCKYGACINESAEKTWCNGTDFNRDGKVDEIDNVIMTANYRRTDCSELNSWCNGTDIGRDRKVLGGDFGIFSTNFRRTDCAGPLCTDTDNGKNYLLKGTTCERENLCKTDFCNGNQLNEYYCNSGILSLSISNCSNGCNNGACKPWICSDGTLEQHCSLIKPLYCSNNILINNCSSCSCEENYYCDIDGSCKLNQTSPIIVIAENEKNMSKYSNKEVFLISDKNWKDVLPLVSAAVWTGNETCQKGYNLLENICVYPFLIFHEESTGFDADSIIWFMQQYSPSKVTIVEQAPQELNNLLIVTPPLGAGLQQNQIKRIFQNNYLNYWKSFNKVVYVEDNYELVLLASTYASLINAPLIIQGTINDNPSILSGRDIICIGNTNNLACNETYNLEQLQQKYIQETSTNKIILVNPNDLNIKVTEQFRLEKSSNYINEIYSKHSLSSPYLASAKKELIISTNVQDYLGVNNLLKNKINFLNFIPQYLTIVASPVAIQMSKNRTNWGKEEIDNHIYGNLDSDSFEEVAVGRIFSLSSSDISSYIARNLFYDKIPKNNEFSVIMESPEAGGGFNKPSNVALEELFRGMGLNSVSFINDTYDRPQNAKVFSNKFMISYEGHGGTSGADYRFDTSSLVYDRVWLNSPMVFTIACSTCAFDTIPPEYGKSNLFCSNLIRRGAIFDDGAAVDAASSPFEFKNIIENLFNGKSIGQAHLEERNKEIMLLKKQNIESGGSIAEYDQHYLLIGDPTFNPLLSKPNLNETTISSTRINSTNLLISINIPRLINNITMNYMNSVTNQNWKNSYFNYPFGSSVNTWKKGNWSLYNSSSGELIIESCQDDGNIIFSESIPSGYHIKQIKNIEYSNSNTTKSVKKMPIFGGYTKPNLPDFDYVLFLKDEGTENIYHFIIKFSYGGNPMIVNSQNKIEEGQLRLYLELEKII